MRVPFRARATGTTGARGQGRASCEPSRVPFATGASQCRANRSFLLCCLRPPAAIKRMLPHLRRTTNRLLPRCPPTSSSSSALAESAPRTPPCPEERRRSSMPPWRPFPSPPQTSPTEVSPSTMWAMFSSSWSLGLQPACRTRASARCSTTFPARRVMRETAAGALPPAPSNSARCSFAEAWRGLASVGARSPFRSSAARHGRRTRRRTARLPGLGSRVAHTAALGCVGLLQTVNGHTNLMHDGRARGFLEAILWHGGEASKLRERVRRMSAQERGALVAFLESL